MSWSSQLGLQNTPTASFHRGETPLVSVLDITLYNQMIRLQNCWRFGECGVPLSLPSIAGPLWPGVAAPDRVLFMGQIALDCLMRY